MNFGLVSCLLFHFIDLQEINSNNGHVLENMLIFLLSLCFAGYGKSLTQMGKKSKRKVNMEVSAGHRLSLPSLKIIVFHFRLAEVFHRCRAFLA